MTCACITDSDGQCVACKASVVNEVKQALGPMVELLGEMEEVARNMEAVARTTSIRPQCNECSKRYVDLAIAQIIPDLSGRTPFVASGFVNAMIKSLSLCGVAAFPHTQKAWSELCVSNGWKPVE